MTSEQDGGRNLIRFVRANADDRHNTDPQTLRDLADLAEEALDRVRVCEATAYEAESMIWDAYQELRFLHRHV